jgi:hypothetical protein
MGERSEPAVAVMDSAVAVESFFRANSDLSL